MSISPSMIAIIAAGVDTMSLGTGYNFNYGPVDIHDPAERVYPQVFLEYGEESPAGVQMAGKITNSIPLTFRVIVAKGVGLIDAEIAVVTDDIKKLMENLQSALSAVGLLYHEFVSATWKPRLVRAYPAEVNMVFNLVYRQDRANPASP